ncbi:MAG: hypothetical protein ABFC96_05205 [Thermoguttaceae bacterium]
MQYEHTQTGWWHRIFLAIAAVLVLGALLARGEPASAWVALSIAAVFLLCALVFGSLTVRGGVDAIALRYGPLPLFRKRIRYRDITAVEPARSSVIDGWGIHYIPGRGWTYNLWGFGCVKLTLGKRVIRVGTDDVERLAEFLRTKIGGDEKGQVMLQHDAP